METGFHPIDVVEVETKYMRDLKARRAEHYLRGRFGSRTFMLLPSLGIRVRCCCSPFITGERSPARTR